MASAPAPNDASSSPLVVGVLLAAGGGRRFDGDDHKLLAELPAADGRPGEAVAARAMAAVCDAVVGGALDRIVIVTGAADLDEIVEGVVAPFDLCDRVALVHNAAWKTGQASSLQAALRSLDGAVDVAVVGLADQPDVSTAAWSAVADAATRPGATPICVATYDGRRRNPVALHRSVWPMLPTTGDHGARDLIRLQPDLVTPVPSPGSPADIDTVEDLRRWQST